MTSTSLNDSVIPLYINSADRNDINSRSTDFTINLRKSTFYYCRIVRWCALHIKWTHEKVKNKTPDMVNPRFYKCSFKPDKFLRFFPNNISRAVSCNEKWVGFFCHDHHRCFLARSF